MNEPAADYALPLPVAASLGKACRIPHLTMVLVCLATLTVAVHYPDTEKLITAREHLGERLKGDIDLEYTAEQLLERSGFTYPFAGEHYKGTYASSWGGNAEAIEKARQKAGKIQVGNSDEKLPQIEADTTELLEYLRTWNDRFTAYRQSHRTLMDLQYLDEMADRSRIRLVPRIYPENDSLSTSDLDYEAECKRISKRAADIERVTCHAPEVRDPTRLFSDRIVSVDWYVPVTVRYRDGHEERFQIRARAHRHLHHQSGIDFDGLLATFMPDLKTFTRTQAYERMNEQLYRETDYVTLLSVSVPKSMFGTLALLLIYGLLFDLAVWMTSVHGPQRAVAGAEDHPSWSLLIPGTAGRTIIVATLLILPYLTAVATSYFFYRSHFSFLMMFASFMGTGLTTLAVVATRAMLRIRNDDQRITRRIVYVGVALICLSQSWPLASAMALPAEESRIQKLDRGWDQDLDLQARLTRELWSYRIWPSLLMSPLNIIHTLGLLLCFGIPIRGWRDNATLPRLLRGFPLRAFVFLGAWIFWGLGLHLEFVWKPDWYYRWSYWIDSFAWAMFWVVLIEICAWLLVSFNTINRTLCGSSLDHSPKEPDEASPPALDLPLPPPA